MRGIGCQTRNELSKVNSLSYITCSPYAGGVYKGKLVFPSEFPFKPPAIYMSTPNGRFKTDMRLCLSISGRSCTHGWVLFLSQLFQMDFLTAGFNSFSLSFRLSSGHVESRVVGGHDPHGPAELHAREVSDAGERGDHGGREATARRRQSRQDEEAPPCCHFLSLLVPLPTRASLVVASSIIILILKSTIEFQM